MLIHLGNGYLVRERDGLGIFNIDGDVTDEITTEFLRKSEERGEVVSAVLDLPRSFVLESVNGKEKVILSHISSVSLAGRKKGF